MTDSLSDISPKKLAVAIGISESFAWQIKTGRRKLPNKHLRTVSETFSIPMVKLRPDLADFLDKPIA